MSTVASGRAATASPKAVLFDLDGTLVDSAHGIARALNVLRAERGAPPITARKAAPWISLGASELVRRGLGGAARDAAEDLCSFRRVLGGLTHDPASVYPGVPGTLSALLGAGLRLGVVSNKPEALCRALLADVGLAHAFSHVVGGDTAAHAKPHPAPLWNALSALSVAAEEAVLIGDSEVDAAAADAVGVRFILYEKGYGRAACNASGYPIHARLSSFATRRALELVLAHGAGVA